MKILIISTCAEKLHELEFVRPVEKIIGSDCKYFVKSYSSITREDLGDCDKVIICGTSLKDNKFLEDLGKWEWLKDFDKPVLGICAGMQILGVVFGGKVKTKKEIGYYFESLNKEFLGMETDPDEGEHEVWHLHNSYVDFQEDDWEIFMRSSDGEKIPEAVKYKEKEFYGVLFHPEVRQKKIIEKFIKIKK